MGVAELAEATSSSDRQVVTAEDVIKGWQLEKRAKEGLGLTIEGHPDRGPLVGFQGERQSINGLGRGVWFYPPAQVQRMIEVLRGP
jgi:hypothetical protein